MLRGLKALLLVLMSYYGIEACTSRECEMACGMSLYDVRDAHVPYCADWSDEFGTVLSIEGNGNETQCVVLDRGPRKSLGRGLDVSPEVFERIDSLSKGVILVQVKKVGTVRLDNLGVRG